ncbi:MAG: hypothetical protein ACLP6E_09970, partial [Acidimicrobiales bacterium]
MSDGENYGAYTANQLASAYDFSALYDDNDLGSRQTVAIFELEPNETSDISAYQTCYGTSASVIYTQEDGGAGTGYGSGEAALDIEDVIGVAPDAAVDVYQAPNDETGLYDNYSAIVSADTAKVVSTSWGLCEPIVEDEESGLLGEENTLFEDAASQGQSVFAAAGDDGSTACYPANGSDSLSVSDPASQPYVTAVGGTTLSDIGPPPTQTVWNDSDVDGGAGGGGISEIWDMPSYQSGAPSSLNVINTNSSGSPCGATVGSYCREVPDVTADADEYTGYVVYFDGGWTAIGGTSAAAPLWAGYRALVDASTACESAPVGFANSDLYKIAGSLYSTTFRDITSGNDDYTPSGYTGDLYPAGAAYDMASGLGSPIGGPLATALCTQLPAGAPIAVASNQDGRLQAFVVGSNGQSYSTWQSSANGTWTTWADLGGTSSLPAGAPIAVASNQDGRLQAFVVGSNGQSYSTWQTSANGAWRTWADLGGTSSLPAG